MQAHDLKVIGSHPTPGTNFIPRSRRCLTLLLSAGLFLPPQALPSEPNPIEETFNSGGAGVTVQLSPHLGQTRADVMEWVHLAADAVIGYYGRFPVPAVEILVAPRPGHPVNAGSEHGGRRIIIHLDPGATRDDLHRDWMLTHEMFHLGFPSLNRDYHYMEEGLSDYLEPLARARKGQETAQRAWKDFIEGMPNGLPRPGEPGLDGTRDWGRTYWGGCFFWLLVDLDIREKTGNVRSLDNAIRAIVEAGGTGDVEWTLEEMMEVGDRATGTGSIRKIHQMLGPAPVDPHLDRLWLTLGIREDRGQVVFDDTAPLAKIRRSMTAPAGSAQE
jgi:hypothetical protein